MLDDPLDGAASTAHDAAITGGVHQVDRKDGQLAARGRIHQRLERFRAGERHIAIQHQGEVVGAGVGQQRQGLHDRMPGAQLRLLLGEIDVGRDQCLAHRLAAVAVDHHDAPRVEAARRIHHMAHQRLAGQGMQHLGQRGIHALALACG